MAHGAVVTAATSTDETSFHAAFSRVVDDLSAVTPELVGDAVFPTKLQSIASLTTRRPASEAPALHRPVPLRLAGSRDRDPAALRIPRGHRPLHGPEQHGLHAADLRAVSVTAAGTSVGFAVDVTIRLARPT